MNFRPLLKKRIYSVKQITAALLACCFALLAPVSQAQQCQTATPVWEDNFDGTSLDTNKWEPMLGDGSAYGIPGWGNSELQSYKAENATVAGGILTITAKKERVKGQKYTSARLRTVNVPNGGEWTNGRFEARLKLPDGTGMWPAFWMLPTNPDVGWPESGEIDILEATGQADMFAFGTIHVGNPWEFSGGRILKQPDAWSDGFHTYAVEWEPNEMRWYVDDLLYSVKTPADLANPSTWAFENYQYHFLLNMAVGGNIGGPVDESMLPQTMDVDYVRVYDFAQPSLTGEHLVEPGSTVSYNVIDEAGTGSSYSWSVPAGATITSGANSSSITVAWGTVGGDVAVTVNSSCGASDLAVNVYVAPALAPETILDDFESNRNLVYTTATGTFNQAASNPAPDSVNGSSVVALYTRNPAEQYDVIVGDTAAIADVNPFVIGDKAFYMDIYTAAAVGTEILIQLENSATATPSNYPTGRHSKFIAHTSVQNAWHRLKFQMEDRIDGTTGDNDVNSLVILIDANSFTGDNYYWDNFNIYGVGGGGNNSAPVSSFNNVCTNLACDFDGSASSDSDGSIVSYAWDFGDGNNASGATASHTYAAAGDYNVTLTVTDNETATNQSSNLVSVTSGGTATSMSVSIVITGTQGAGKGQKYGKATVTIVDNNGGPVNNATVTGDFSGSIVEAGVSGVTGADGSVVLLTTATAGGNISVDFCVSALSHASLSHNTSASTGLCQ